MSLLIVLYIVNFIKTIFIIVVIYYGIKLITRFVLPLLIDKGIRNMQQKMNEQQMNTRHSSRPNGDVTIENNKRRGHRNDVEGEYVDFEEID